MRGAQPTSPVGPAPVHQIEKRDIRDSVKMNLVNILSHQARDKNWQAYTGISARGAVSGAIPKLHHIFFRWNSCRSVAMVRSRLGIFSSRTELPGNSTSILFFPYASSTRRCALSDGMLFSPHSSNGIRCWTRLPQVTRCFCQPFSASSHFAQV